MNFPLFPTTSQVPNYMQPLRRDDLPSTYLAAGCILLQWTQKRQGSS